ncbi:MAG: hypothetical protein HOK28_03125 [Deltaproteobacteria bacterium]|jgi:hypothetical protein|nr:hypothetical protein [Deltaproteobacteria bacterium]
MKKLNKLILVALLQSLVLVGCGDDVGHDDHDHDDHEGHDHDPNEVMTTLKLTFTANSDGSSFVASWADPENDGSPVIDDITLTNGETYTVTFGVLNELEDPAEDITPEITDEKDEHQVFFTGSAVEGPAHTSNPDAVVEHVYEDSDNNGFPIGLTNSFLATVNGTGVLSVLLRHMPPVNGEAVKTGTLAQVMDSGSATDLPGSTDINVDFNVTVE